MYEILTIIAAYTILKISNLLEKHEIRELDPTKDTPCQSSFDN